MTEFSALLLPYIVAAVLAPLAIIRGWDLARNVMSS